jgi:hypothetical protein
MVAVTPSRVAAEDEHLLELLLLQTSTLMSGARPGTSVTLCRQT